MCSTAQLSPALLLRGKGLRYLVVNSVVVIVVSLRSFATLRLIPSPSPQRQGSRCSLKLASVISVTSVATRRRRVQPCATTRIMLHSVTGRFKTSHQRAQFRGSKPATGFLSYNPVSTGL